MTNSSLSEIVAALKRASNIAVLSHYNPDPDAYASSCALALTLESLGKNVVLVNETGPLPRYDFIAGSERIQKTIPEGHYDLMVTCDCGDLKRVGDSLMEKVRNATVLLNIDHHFGNDHFGHLNLVDENASSASEVVFRILEALECAIPPGVASALYAGVSADTGSFRYASTTENTFAVAQRLVRLGASPAEVGNQLFSRNSVAAVRLHAEALAGLKLHCAGRLCELVVTGEMVERCGAAPLDTENLVEKGRDVDGVLVSFLMRWDVDIWRISLRSRSNALDVSEIARSFGGGGHRAAAAFRWRKSFDELRAALLERLISLCEKV